MRWPYEVRCVRKSTLRQELDRSDHEEQLNQVLFVPALK